MASQSDDTLAPSTDVGSSFDQAPGAASSSSTAIRKDWSTVPEHISNTWTLAPQNGRVTGWFWDHGYEVRPRDSDGQCTPCTWICCHCIADNNPNPKTYVATNTRNLEYHLWKHKVHHPDPSKARRPQVAASKRARGHPGARSHIRSSVKRKRDDVRDVLAARFNPKQFQRLIVQWLTDANLPFHLSEHRRLRKIFAYLNPLVDEQSAHISHQTVRRLIIREYTGQEDGIITALRRSPSQVHIAFDGWTSRNRLSFFSINAFFLEPETFKPQKIVLGVPTITGAHTGENIAGAVMEVLRKFELGVNNNKVGYFVLDNASNNDSAIDKIGAELHWQHPLHRRIRCFGHVLHLVVRAMLSTKDHDSSNLEDVDPDDFNEWQKRGPVGKLHNLVVWIHRTNKAMQYLRDQQKDDPDKTFHGVLNVLLDNSTRWLSQYYMIERALKLKPYLEDLMIEATRGARSTISTTCPSCLAPGNLLTTADWDILGWFNDILAKFNICLLQLEGDGQARIRKGGVEKEYGSTWRVFSAYERLFKTLRKAKAAAEASDRTNSSFYSVCINSALAKLEKYHTKLDETPIIYAATVLHPAMRWSVIKKSLKRTPEKLAKAHLLVQTLWEEQYRDLPVQWRTPTRRPNPANTGDSNMRTSDDEDIWDSDDEVEVVCDEYEKWCDTSPARDTLNDNPLEFWYDNRFEYPRLAKMAIDVLSIPAMSAECERTFSSAGTMVDSKRSRLDASTIAVTQTLRSWLRAGLVKDEYDGLLHKMDDDSEMAEAMSKLVIDEIAEAIDDD